MMLRDCHLGMRSGKNGLKERPRKRLTEDCVLGILTYESGYR